VSSSGGSAARSIAGYVDGARRTIAVRGAAPPALERMLWGAGSPGDDLFRASGARCFTLAALKARIASTLAPAGYPVRFRLGSLAPYEGLAGARGARYREGCAVIAGVQPEFPGGRIVIVADLLQRGPRG
jgi:hypothetical protein